MTKYELKSELFLAGHEASVACDLACCGLITGYIPPPSK